MEKNSANHMAVVIIALVLSGCLSDPAHTSTALEKASWTEENLEQYQIESSTSANTAVHNYRAVSGRLVSLFRQVAQDAVERFGKQCGENFVADHIFYFMESETAIILITSPRAIPDEKNQFREDGRKISIPFIPGARFLNGCFLQYKYDKIKKQLNYVKRIP